MLDQVSSVLLQLAQIIFARAQSLMDTYAEAIQIPVPGGVKLHLGDSEIRREMLPFLNS